MKRQVVGNIQSRALFDKIFLPLIISAAWVIIQYVFLPRHMESISIDIANIIIVTSLGIYMQFYIFVYLIEGVTIDNTNLQFSGLLSEYVKISLSGIILSAITLGIYLPWFLRNIYEFFAKNTSYRGSSASFKGIPQNLLKYMVIFLIAYILLLFLGFGIIFNGGLFLFIIFLIALLLWAVSFIHIQLTWSLQFSFRGYTTKCTMSKGDGARFLLGQMLLILITLGIYSPWAYLKIVTLYTKNLHIQDNEGNIVFLTFHPESGDGLLILGQILLICITLGIYRPFALGNIGNRLIPRIQLETPDKEYY